MQQRATFGSKLGVVLASVGSAVGLGNIWRFPYETGRNGGGAFLIVYILCVLFLGLVVMLAEFFIGRTARKNPVGAYKFMAPHKPWVLIGYNGVLTAFFIFGFYAVVSGWTLEYMFQSAIGSLHDCTVDEYNARFGAFTGSVWRPLIWLVIFVALTHLIVVSGVKKGIERSSKILMPMLFVILVVLCVRSVLLPNSIEGLKFFFNPDFNKINSSVVLSAVGQAFFSVSVGLGCMITYASYFGGDTNLQKTALSVVLLDTLVAILAGVVIFPAVFSFGIEPTQGAKLVFVTLPNIFQQIPLGSLWEFIFFALLTIAALTSLVSVHEVVTAYFQDEHAFSRRKAALTVTLIGLVSAIVCSLSLNVLDSYKIFNKNFFDFLDFLTSKIMLPLGGMFTCIFVGWFVDKKYLQTELTNNGAVKFYFFKLFVLLLKYLAPLVIGLVFLYELNLI